MNDTFRKKLASALVLVIIFGLPIGSVFAENKTGEERFSTVSEAADGIPIDEEHSPDENFRDFVEANHDTNKDGHLSDAERNAVETIILGGGKIKSLEGIAYFPELVKLDTSWQNLRSLDLKSNSKLEILFCQGNSGLRSLDMTQNSNLKHLVCTQTAVKSLDLSANPELVTLECGSTGIENLDLSGKDQLETVNVFMNEKLRELNLSGCTSLKALDCYKCGLLEKLDLSESTALESLNTYQNYAMKELIFAKETPDLSSVNCESNRALGSITIPDGRAITTSGRLCL